MKNFLELKNHCQKNSFISAEVIDKELIYNAAAKDKLEKEFLEELKKYSRITFEWQRSYVNMMLSQLIAHRLFKENGLIHKYLNHSYIKKFIPEHQEFLKKQSEYAWRFTFSEIISEPEQNFFEMEDVFSEETYLLYSPGISQMLKESTPNLWLLLIGYNGECWQTFGLNIPLKGIHADDIFFFAGELDPSVSDEEGILKNIDQNPLPYLMLLDVSMAPDIFHHGQQMGNWFSYDHPVSASFDVEKLKSVFTVEWNQGVYKLTLKKAPKIQLFSVAYYDEEKKSISRYTLSEKSFTDLTKQLNKFGFELEEESDVRLSFNMYRFLEDFFDAEMHIDPYADLFEREVDEEAEQELNELRQFMDIAFERYNNNLPVDPAAIAKEVGADVKLAKKIWDNFKKENKKY